MRLRSTPIGDSESLLNAARLKSRILAILEGALEESGMTQVELAERLGVRKAAINNTLHGNGNVTMSTLAEYLHAMGFEADVTLVDDGEILASMQERRAPVIRAVTIRDRDRDRAVRAHLDFQNQLTGTRSSVITSLGSHWGNSIGPNMSGS